MAKTNWQDPKTSEIRSTHISGLQEAVGKLEESVGIETVSETNIPLEEVFISHDDRYRIFQAPEGKRNWLLSPTPIIKKNGSTITSGFEIDYGGGAIVLNVNDTVANTYTADVTYTVKLENNLKNDIIKIKNRLQLLPVKSWVSVQHIVRQGLANEYFSVGDQLVSLYDGKEIIWEVIGIDVDTPADSNFTHSMTLQTKDCLYRIQFDAPEPTNPNSDRKNYGNNRYIYSAVRQWLNSNESVFNWQSQHQYDARPDASLDLYDGAGFLHRLDPELVAVIGEVNKKVAKASVDGSGQDTFSDKVFLLSRVEVGLGTEGNVAGEFVYPFYDGITNAERIKQLNGNNSTWWLRSPLNSYSNSVRNVYTSGAVNGSGARNAHGLSPACVII